MFNELYCLMSYIVRKANFLTIYAIKMQEL